MLVRFPVDVQLECPIQATSTDTPLATSPTITSSDKSPSGVLRHPTGYLPTRQNSLADIVTLPAYGAVDPFSAYPALALLQTPKLIIAKYVRQESNATFDLADVRVVSIDGPEFRSAREAFERPLTLLGGVLWSMFRAGRVHRLVEFVERDDVIELRSARSGGAKLSAIAMGTLEIKKRFCAFSKTDAEREDDAWDRR